MSRVIQNNSIGFFPGAAYELVIHMFGVRLTILAVKNNLLTTIRNYLVILIIMMSLFPK